MDRKEFVGGIKDYFDNKCDGPISDRVTTDIERCYECLEKSGLNENLDPLFVPVFAETFIIMGGLARSLLVEKVNSAVRK